MTTFLHDQAGSHQPRRYRLVEVTTAKTFTLSSIVSTFRVRSRRPGAFATNSA